LADRRKTREGLTERVVYAGLVLLPLVVIGFLWYPVFRAYRVPGIRVTDEMVQLARQFPDDSVLEELSKFDLLDGEWKQQQKLIDTASQLLNGDMKTRTCSTHVTVPFSSSDLGNVPPGCRLPLAGFWLPEVWLRAYEVSGRQEFFDAAQAAITGAQAYGQTAWFPRGEFWNDHALASRITVLANFWRLYRHSPQYRPEVAQQVLEMAGRTEQLLAKPGLFTFATNHGVMQNLGLWHAALAFPSLPGMREYQRLAKSRLNDQMKFYISDEGVVLEHSADYQKFGLMLVGRALRYLALSHEGAPPDWLEKYRKAQEVYAMLRRPDGSMPMFGDTDSDDDEVGALVSEVDSDGYVGPLIQRTDWKPGHQQVLYPASGYSIWWDNLEVWPDPRELSQTVLCWSNFAGHGHKHADEMSVLFWADGQNWWSNVGYWPYDTQGREDAVSWAGSNAPHLAGESEGSLRSTQLISSGGSESITAIDLERDTPEGYVARRQLIHYRPGLWIVLDSTVGPERAHTTTTWTAGTNVRWQPGLAPGSFLLQSAKSQDQMNVFSLSSPGAAQKLLQESYKPFAGWQIDGGRPVAASALVTEQPANSWAAMIWNRELDPAARLASSPQMSSWISPTSWEIKWHTPVNSFTLSRRGDKLVVHPDNGLEQNLDLITPAPVIAPRAELRNEFVRATVRYPIIPSDSPRRTRITDILVPIFLLQELLFSAYKWLKGDRIRELRWFAALVWIIGAVWLIGFHL
jgi:hypothetical protein